jgi:predicted transposase YbfD/YdcC
MAEWHRKGLKRHSLPWNVVAIDGKHLGTVPEKQLRTVLEDDPKRPASADELRARCAAKFPWVQVQDGAGGVVGLVRTHNVTLVSSDAAVTIHQRPIEGKTNEIGALPRLLNELKQYYGHTSMMQVLTLDAGNTSRATCQQIRKDIGHYFGRLTDAQGDVYHEAVQILGRRTHDRADHTFCDKDHGQVMEYRVWTEPLPGGYLAWSDARQLIRVQRTVTNDDGSVRVGERYVITSMDTTMANAELALQLLRSHWRIENETHWTSDTQWQEDAKRTPWTKHPDGLLVTAALRAMALNITALMRALTCYAQNPDAPDEEKVWVKPTWKRIQQTILLLFCEPLLDTTRFDRAALA